LSEHFIPGVASWNDSSNNTAILSGELYCTANGISIYVAAKDDPTKKELAEDTYHALMPVGPVGKPTELQLCVPILAFNFTKYPNAAKAFVAFMLEKENYEKWLSGARGYLTQTLNAYDSAPVWTADPKNAVFAQASKRALPASGIGTPGEKAATPMADIALQPRSARAPIREATPWDQLKHNRNWLGFWFMLPAMAFLVLFLAYPLGLGIWLSFTDTRIGRIGQYIGSENYEWLWD